MSCWKCPKCGWGLDGGDETGVRIEPPYGVYELNIPPLDQDMFFYCFHCGYKMPEPDSLEKLRDDIKSCGNCGKCVAIVGHCDDSNDRVDLYDQSCESWTPRTDDPEQRCQQLERKYEMAFKAMVECEEQRYQLEQVARDMLAYIGSVTFLLDNKFQSRDDARKNAKAFVDFDNKLKALGG